MVLFLSIQFIKKCYNRNNYRNCKIKYQAWAERVPAEQSVVQMTNTTQTEGKKQENRRTVITAICILVIMASVVAVFAIAAEKRKAEAFDFQRSLEDVAITVDSEEVTLKEVSYYIMVAETNQNAAAYIYNDKNPNAFWNIRLNYKYVSQMAEEVIINACIRDNIYYLQALEEGYQLSEEQQKEIEETALEEIQKMTDYQRELTAYQKEDMVQVLTKIQYAKNYVADLMEEGYEQEALDVDGEKYEEIAENYKTTTNKDIWNNLTIGKVTINKEKE